MNHPQYITPKGTYVQLPDDFYVKIGLWIYDSMAFDNCKVDESGLSITFLNPWQPSSQVNNNHYNVDDPYNSLERIRYRDNTDNPTNQANY
jgi:hypothetical protein